MPRTQIVIAAIPMVVGTILVMELFFHFQVNQYIHVLKGTALKACVVLSRSRISDHWKEIILPCYAVKILSSIMKLSYYLGLLVLSFGLAYGVIGLMVFENFLEGLENLYRLDMQIIVLGVSVIHGIFRNRLRHG